MSDPKLREMLAEYRRLKACSPSKHCLSNEETEAAIAIADYLLTLDAQDIDSHPACPPIDAARKPESNWHPMNRIDFE